MKKQMISVWGFVFILSLAACNHGVNDEMNAGSGESIGGYEVQESSESETNATAPTEMLTAGTVAEKTLTAPSKEEVLATRSVVLEGMSEEEIARLTENIKVANLQMEEAWMYDDLFGKLEDKNHLYWNYFDQKGDIQIGWEYGGSYSDVQKICKEENLTVEAFYEKYGTPKMVYNRFDANNFMDLMTEMKESVNNEALQNDLQYIIDETRAAQENHEVEHVNNLYRTLHDMDYFLLRYGIEDVGRYTQDASTVATYYGALSVYSEN